mgnify:CR=1 FL=1
MLRRSKNKKVFNRIKEYFISFYRNIVCDKRFILVLLFFALVAFGYDLFNTTISMDDMTFAIFGKEQHYAVRIMRWGIYLIYPFISTIEFSPFINSLFALLFLLLAAILLCFLFYCLSSKKANVFAYTILASLFVTYPLINEIWDCSAMSVNILYNGVSFYMCLVLLAAIYLYFIDGYSIKSIAIAGLLLSPVMAGYESVIAFYVTLVFIIIYFKNYNDEYFDRFDWLLDGIRYALPLIIALAVRIIVGNALIMIFNVEPMSSLARTKWASGFNEVLINILYNGWYYIIRGLSYFPIGEFVIALIVFIIITIKDARDKKSNIAFGIFILISVFLLSLVQGDYLYYRLAQTVQLFVAYTGYLIVDRYNLKYKQVIIGLMLLVCLRQSICLHDYLTLNNQRSENEAYIARQIGYKIYSEFDKDKTVIFCGEYQLGDFIQDQIIIDEDSLGGKVENYFREKMGVEQTRKYEEFVFNNINSYFNKQMDAFNGQTLLKRYLSYYGFDINVLSDLTDEEEDRLKGYYEKIAKQEGMKPYEVKDMGDYILVYLGPTIDNAYKLKY